MGKGKDRKVRRLLGFAVNRNGSFAIEATLIYPVVFLATLAGLAIGMFVYERAMLTQAAALSAERTAAHWGNSFGDESTGAAPDGVYDKLYWRLTDDSLMGLLGFSGSGDAVVKLPEGLDANPQNIIGSKLVKAAKQLPQGIHGELRYTNAWIKRNVSVRIAKMFRFPSFLASWTSDGDAHSRADVLVTEPVEFIRTIDLTRTYIQRLKQALSTKSVPELSGNPTTSAPEPEKIEIRSEAEAVAYLKKTIGGTTVWVNTETVGDRRKIDVLDHDGIAHEAKYTLNVSDAKQQLLKDAELMRRGIVKGVVWHFFRTKKGTVPLSAALRKELERNGIVVIIHN